MEDKIISVNGSTNPEYIRWNTQHEKALNQTRIPLIDVNGRTLSINPFEGIAIITDYKYMGATCFRTDKEDFFFFDVENKLFIDFISTAQIRQGSYFSKKEPWTKKEPFPNGYNKYRKQLKLVIFVAHSYVDYIDFDGKHLSIDIEGKLKELGIVYQFCEFGVSSIVNFWNCENVPELLPPYYKVYNMNKVDFKFHGSMLDKETIESIKNYML